MLARTARGTSRRMKSSSWRGSRARTPSRGRRGRARTRGSSFVEPELVEIGPRVGTLLHFDHLAVFRSEEHTSELQSHSDLVCRLLLEKKKSHRHELHSLLLHKK